MMRQIFELLLPALFGKLNFYFGGGPSGSSSTYYANQDKLLGTQADIAQGIYNNIYQPNAPAAVGALNDLRSTTPQNSADAAPDARRQAETDSIAATGNAQAGMNHNLSLYGINPNSGAFAGMNRDLAVQGAANQAGAMNNATQWAKQYNTQRADYTDNQKWAKNLDFYNALSGIPSNASASLGNAASGYGGMGANQTNQGMANARGYGTAGGMFGSTLFSKDGGLVVKKGQEVHMKRGGVCMAAGGLMQLPDWRGRSSNVTGPNVPNPIASFAGSAAMGAGAQMAKGALKPYIDPIRKGIQGLFSGMPQPAMPGAVSASPAAEGALQTAPIAEGGSEVAAASELAPAVAESAAADAAATTAATMTAEEALPLILLAKDGGSIRQDMTPGGDVSGPGGPRDDKVPAMLSDGEYVLNAAAVKRIGVKNLDKLNGSNKPAEVAKGGLKLAGGGFLDNLGVALGAGVDEINRQKEQARLDQAAEIQKASAAQSQAMGGIQLQNAQQTQADTNKSRATFDAMNADMEKVRNGDYSGLGKLAQVYNQQVGPYNDGHTVEFQDNGNGMDAVQKDATGKEVQRAPLNPATAAAAVQQFYQPLIDNSSFTTYQNTRAARNQLALKQAEFNKDLQVAGINAQGQANRGIEAEKLKAAIPKRELIQDDNSTQAVSIGQDGTVQATPVPGMGGKPGKAGKEADPNKDQNALLNNFREFVGTNMKPALGELPTAYSDRANAMLANAGKIIQESIAAGKPLPNTADLFTESIKRYQTQKNFDDTVQKVMGDTVPPDKQPLVDDARALTAKGLPPDQALAITSSGKGATNLQPTQQGLVAVRTYTANGKSYVASNAPAAKDQVLQYATSTLAKNPKLTALTDTQLLASPSIQSQAQQAGMSTADFVKAIRAAQPKSGTTGIGTRNVIGKISPASGTLASSED